MWLEESRKLGILRVECVFLDVSKEETRQELREERQHEEEQNQNTTDKVDEDDDAADERKSLKSALNANLMKPFLREGFTEMYTITSSFNSSRVKLGDTSSSSNNNNDATVEGEVTVEKQIANVVKKFV